MMGHLLLSIWRKVLCVNCAVRRFAVFKALKNGSVKIEVPDHADFLSVEYCKIGRWHVMSGRSIHTGGWTAWAKSSPMLRSDPMDEPGNPLFFEFGKTREDAISRLVIADLGHLLPNASMSGPQRPAQEQR